MNFEKGFRTLNVPYRFEFQRIPPKRRYKFSVSAIPVWFCCMSTHPTARIRYSFCAHDNHTVKILCHLPKHLTSQRYTLFHIKQPPFETEVINNHLRMELFSLRQQCNQSAEFVLCCHIPLSLHILTILWSSNRIHHNHWIDNIQDQNLSNIHTYGKEKSDNIYLKNAAFFNYMLLHNWKDLIQYIIRKISQIYCYFS